MVRRRETKMSRRARAQGRGNYQVFVSHATADKWLAMRICEKIQEVGGSTFRDDRDINGGDDIPEEIRQQIKHSQEMVVLLTPESVGREWVLLEVGAAWGWRKNFRIVAILDHVDINPIPEIIKSKKAISINDLDNYLSEISTRVKKAANAKK
jgi:hypothetical protein